MSRVGTCKYMPPDGRMDPRADVYAAGLDRRGLSHLRVRGRDLLRAGSGGGVGLWQQGKRVDLTWVQGHLNQGWTGDGVRIVGRSTLLRFRQLASSPGSRRKA